LHILTQANDKGIQDINTQKQLAMTGREFYLRVVEMRKAQKLFFKTRDRGVLNKSKALEREIDEEIKRVEAVIRQHEQPKLF